MSPSTSALNSNYETITKHVNRLVQPPKRRVATVRFQSKFAELTEEGIQYLHNELEGKIDTTTKISIVGSADSKGQPSFNLKLSKKRAEAVGRWIMSKYDVIPGNMNIAWLGSPNNGKNLSDNRIVTIYILDNPLQ